MSGRAEVDTRIEGTIEAANADEERMLDEIELELANVSGGTGKPPWAGAGFVEVSPERDALVANIIEQRYGPNAYDRIASLLRERWASRGQSSS